MIISPTSNLPFLSTTERHALEKAYAYLPESEHITYVGFPWANLFNAIEAQSTDCAYWLEQLGSTIEKITPASRVVTVCEHKKLLMHISLLKSAGITNIFWSYAKTADCSASNSGILIHPFPIYPTNSEVAVIDENFGLCTTDGNLNEALLWECLHKGLMPIIPENFYALPGNKDLWSAVTILYRDDELSLLPEKIQEIKSAAGIMAGAQLSLKQLNKLYGIDFFITDIVEFFFNQENRTVSDATTENTYWEKYSYDEKYIAMLSFLSTLITNPESSKNIFSRNYFLQRKIYYALKNSEAEKNGIHKETLNHYGIKIG